MVRPVLIVLIAALVTLHLCDTTEGQENCGLNKIFNPCGSACPPTCKQPGPRPCSKKCAIGCQCRRGLYTQPDGSCIEPSQCP